MASAVQHSLLSPLPGLGTLKSRNSSDGYGENSVGDPTLGVETPTSSADPASERIDPVLLLSRPVEGFNHPRQHLFTDRLLGRFYEDSSLDAETRKTSKCLAGRLGTAGSNTTTRPSTTATTASHLRSSHSPTTTRRGGKRMHGSASARAVGREPGGGGLAGRKEQVQKEILEQKALIEKLEGRVASLSGGRGARNAASHGLSAPSKGDGERDANRHRQGTDDRPSTTPGPESVEAEQGRGDVECKYGSAEQNQRDHHNSDSVRGRAGSRSRKRRSSNCSELADHGPNARRDSVRHSSESTARLGQQMEERSAVAIQRNVRGIGQRKKFLTLQSAREDFEHHLQALLSAAATALEKQKQQQQEEDNSGGGIEGGIESKVKSISAAAVRLQETSRADGLSKPPFDILQAMYSGINDVGGALESLSSEEGKLEAGAGADSGIYNGSTSCSTSMVEAWGMTKEALEAIREAVGADLAAIGKGAAVRGHPGASSPVVAGHHQDSPVGSGRAAAVAMASGRGGLLASPGVSPTSYQELPVGKPSSIGSAAGSVSLRTLDVQGVAQLLRSHDFEEHAPGFIAQAVDGVMLSDPNLCEADFAELGLGEGVEGPRNSRARMVSFFRQCQQSGVVLPEHEGSSLSLEEGVRSRPDDQHAGGSIHGEKRDDESRPGQSHPVSSEESRWRRGSSLVDRENQRVLAEITLNSSQQTGYAGGPTSGGGGDGRRISLKLNQGVVITAGSQEVSLENNTEEFSAGDTKSDAEGEAAAAGKEGGEAPPAMQGRRRTSVGLPARSLYQEPAGDGDGLEAKGTQPLPPGVAVTTADTTVNVFR